MSINWFKKIKTKYIRSIYHFKGGSMKKRSIHYVGGDYICFLNFNICGPVIAYLENITNLEILPYILHYS